MILHRLWSPSIDANAECDQIEAFSEVTAAIDHRCCIGHDYDAKFLLHLSGETTFKRLYIKPSNVPLNFTTRESELVTCSNGHMSVPESNYMIVYRFDCDQRRWALTKYPPMANYLAGARPKRDQQQ
jgi:hypothetical protein